MDHWILIYFTPQLTLLDTDLYYFQLFSEISPRKKTSLKRHNDAAVFSCGLLKFEPGPAWQLAGFDIILLGYLQTEPPAIHLAESLPS